MLQRISSVAASVSRAFAAVLSAVMAALILWVVYERFVQGTTPHWAEELPRFVMVWAAFVGGVVCSYDRSHLMAGLLPFFIRSSKTLRMFERLNHVLICAGMAVLGWAGWELALMTMDQMLPAVDISAGLVYLALPVGSALTIVVHVAQFFEPASSDLASESE